MKQKTINFRKKGNPLKKLFGFGKKNKITKEEFLKTRNVLEKE